jgi:hypothetical protein
MKANRPQEPEPSLTVADYHPRLWERIVSATAAVTIVGLIGFLVVRNQPFSDPNLVILVRILLAFATAVLGATIPGALHVNWSGKGVAVRATGAVGFFILTFFFTPAIVITQPLPAKATTTVQPNSNKTVHGPVTIYFGSSYDKRSETSSPDYVVTNDVKRAVQTNADWIASLGDSVQEVIIYSNVDEGVSSEMALALADDGAGLVENLLAADGINRRLMRRVSYGKERRNSVFETQETHLRKNYNNYVSITVTLK